MFTLTASAAEQILLAAQNQTDGAALPMLRIAAKYGDEGEIVYGMGFDEQREHDAVIETAGTGVVILIAPPSQELLEGTTLDFAELHPGEFQFVFINPHEPGGCSSDRKTGGCSGCSCG
jgi:iron-sulfur cluster assembly protein